MAFRADEAARQGYEEVENYFTRSTEFDAQKKANIKEALRELVQEKNLGHVVDGYPSWHPLVSHSDDRNPTLWPSRECGYEGLDHTRFFVGGFITCPYREDANEVVNSIDKIKKSQKFATSGARINAEVLDISLYHPNTIPILVTCELYEDFLDDGTIPASVAVPLMLEKELPCRYWAQRAESWDSMRPCFLGQPHGKRSSLFVNQETGMSMKKIWELLISTGMYGEIK